MSATVFRVLGLKQFEKAMAEVQKKLDNRKKVNAQATVIVDGWVQRNFEQQGKMSMGGKGWAPLAASTLARRRKGGTSGEKILMDRGGLKTKWKHLWTSAFAKVQSGVNYAKYHDDPKSKRKKLPLRRILPTNKQIWPSLEKLYGAYLKKILK